TCGMPDGRELTIIDLPGIYSLRLELPERKVCADCLDGQIGDGRPDAALVVVDANNLPRNLQFAASALRRALPTVIAVNMIDLAQRRGFQIDAAHASRVLGVPVVPVSARTGSGMDALKAALAATVLSQAKPAPQIELPDGEPGSAASVRWASSVLDAMAAGSRPREDDTQLHDRLDWAFTHPRLGLLLFAAVMSLLFATIFWLAQFPMEWVDLLFASLGGFTERMLPGGILQDLIVSGVIGGVAATVIFLPQILLLFFLLALLEDCGYLARAAFAIDRVMRRFGLPGQAFMPLLSAHACALPAVMATRLIPSRRDRIATIMAIPFMSCSARVPVYALLTTLLFVGRPWAAGVAFISCYALGAIAGIATAALVGRSVLRGSPTPMLLELPAYRLPNIAQALRISLDRGWLFLRNAGSVILAIAIVMWWLSAYPIVRPPETATALREQAARIMERDAAAAEALDAQASRTEQQAQQAGSFSGKIGSALEPIFAPIGLDRQLTVAVITSFLAREVFTTTVFVLTGAGGDAQPSESTTLDSVRTANRDDGTPLFSTATSASLLVFFVLALQCLPTVAVVARETGSWKWAIGQLAFMSLTAYLLALLTYRVLS
ncbi:MAG: ferrous iron transporter B, partial [Planctomycetota bacterium]